MKPLAWKEKKQFDQQLQNQIPKFVQTNQDQQPLNHQIQNNKTLKQKQIGQSRIYPFTKEHSKVKFRTKDQFQMVFDKGQVIKYLSQQLKNMATYGFEFQNFYEEYIQKFRRKKTISRKIYVKFQCQNCIGKMNRKRAWTSILGNMQIQFYVKKQYILNGDHKVNWKVHVYSQDCIVCRKPGTPLVFKSQLQACGIQFCRILAEIINDVPPPDHIYTRYKLIQNHHHIQKLCQACKKGKCFNMPKTQKYKVKKGQH